jgi:hypothetical protein
MSRIRRPILCIRSTKGSRRTKVLEVPKVGVEPTRPFGHRILSPARLPFRHFGVDWG